MIPEIEKALYQLGIDYKSSNDYVSIQCPFASETHEGGTDDNPSFTINPEKDIAGCWTCGMTFNVEQFFVEYGKYSGNLIDFDFFEVYRPPRLKKEEKNFILSEEILDSFTKDDPRIVKYLNSRGVRYSNLPYSLYYDDRNRSVVMPVRDSRGRLTGCTSRSTGKFGNKTNHYFRFLTSQELLGHELHKHNRAIVVEGMTCVLAAQDFIKQLGWEYNVYGIFGSKLSDTQARQLAELDSYIYVALDLDKPGIDGRKEATNKLDYHRVMYKEVFWQGQDRDVGDLTIEEFETIFS